MRERVVRVTITEAGETYRHDIPEIWLVGMSGRDCTIEDAVWWWHYQEMLSRTEEK